MPAFSAGLMTFPQMSSHTAATASGAKCHRSVHARPRFHSTTAPTVQNATSSSAMFSFTLSTATNHSQNRPERSASRASMSSSSSGAASASGWNS